MDATAHTPLSWTAAALQEAVADEADHYVEFLRVPALSGGLYSLAAGSTDEQMPHTEDEVYVVLRGRAEFVRGDERAAIGPGDTLFVAANVEHRFVDISEDLDVLVFFAPAEGTNT
jgi:mannose-6-phosphate isomerase-like protein (cupin superfamily)